MPGKTIVLSTGVVAVATAGRLTKKHITAASLQAVHGLNGTKHTAERLPETHPFTIPESSESYIKSTCARA